MGVYAEGSDVAEMTAEMRQLLVGGHGVVVGPTIGLPRFVQSAPVGSVMRWNDTTAIRRTGDVTWSLMEIVP